MVGRGGISSSECDLTSTYVLLFVFLYFGTGYMCPSVCLSVCMYVGMCVCVCLFLSNCVTVLWEYWFGLSKLYPVVPSWLE